MPRLDDLLGIVSIASAGLLFAVALPPIAEPDASVTAYAGAPLATAAAAPVAGRESPPPNRLPEPVRNRT